MFSATKLFVLAAAAAPAFATVYMTAPVGSTSWAAGTSQTITWQDDGSTPALGNFGSASVGVYVGSVNQQVSLFILDDYSYGFGSMGYITVVGDGGGGRA